MALLVSSLGNVESYAPVPYTSSTYSSQLEILPNDSSYTKDIPTPKVNAKFVDASLCRFSQIIFQLSFDVKLLWTRVRSITSNIKLSQLAYDPWLQSTLIFYSSSSNLHLGHNQHVPST